MRLGRRWLGVALIGALLAAAALWVPTRRLWRAAEFLKALSGTPAKPPPAQPGRAIPPPPSPTIVEEDLTIAGATGPIRARLYRPAQGGNGRGMVVAHGVHYRGIDERRLVPFVRELARTGLVVLTPELAELADYRITPQGVRVIADAVRALATRRDLLDAPQVGLLGFSFAGGLSLVAASKPEVGKHLAFVASVGGHHDLTRVLRFLIQGELETPSGVKKAKPHDYGLVVLTYGYIDRFVPEADLRVMRDALRSWLHDDRKGALASASLRTTAESERLWTLLESENLRVLAPELEVILRSRRAELQALSPRGRLRAIRAPVYLLHGAHDAVIPPSEVDWASLELESADHRALVTPLLDHVEVSREATFSDRFALVQFMSNIL